MASQRLPEEASSLLLWHSDLVPGTVISKNDGYWTGTPVPSIKSYALMRTWPAPEMPRPGCVWTHTILIGFSDIARFTDLGVLRNLFSRPRVSEGFGAYSSALTVGPEILTDPLKVAVSDRESLRVLRALYSPRAKGVVAVRNSEIDDAVFAVWSQQWPRLRRTFSFRTVGQAVEAPGQRSRIDLRITRDIASVTSQTEEDEGYKHLVPWEKAALQDIASSEPTDFRRFLWRYGSDLRRGRARFRFLANLFAEIKLPAAQRPTVAQILSDVAKALPEADDGQLLKGDLLVSGWGPYSLLPHFDQLEVIAFLVLNKEEASFEYDLNSAFDAVPRLWETRKEELLSISASAAEQESLASEQLFSKLSHLIEPTTIPKLSVDKFSVLRRVVKMRPWLLDCDELANVPQAELEELLRFLPDDEQLIRRVVRHLLSLVDYKIASYLAGRAPDIVEEVVIEAFNEGKVEALPTVAQPWFDEIYKRKPAAVLKNILGVVGSTAAIYTCVSLIKFDIWAGLQVALSEWAGAIARSQDNVTGQPRQNLLSYLLTLALRQPRPGAEPLFEVAFEEVHLDILGAKLPQGSFNELERNLPNLHWWDQWDTCLRLRLAVVDAYVDNGLDPESFRRLTKDHALFKKLISAAELSKQGKRYIKRVFTS